MRKIIILALAAAAVTAAMIALAAGVPAGATPPKHTAQVVVRPVHADGRPVKGYRVVHEHYRGFDCWGTPSPVSVSRNVQPCGSSYVGTMACWKSRHHTVLCLRNPRVKVLVRIRYVGRFRAVPAPRHPVPEAMRLGTGNYCTIRDGGAWDRVIGHPRWYGTYTCTRGDLYGPVKNYGIVHTDPWRVHVVKHAGQPNQHIRDLRVAKAFFVGTAA